MKKVIPRSGMWSIFLKTIERVQRELPGAFGVCAVRLEDGARLAANDDATFPAASVIKIAVALEVLCALEEHTLDPSTRLVLRETDRVIGSGVLSALEAGLTLPIADVLYLSTAISDNTAANLLIDRVGVAAVNARLATLGLVTTRLTGKILVEGGNGESSPATAAELVALLSAIHRRNPVLPARACERLVALLERTQTASTIGRGLPDERFPGVGPTPPTITLAYKTGSLRGIITEAALVYTPRMTYAVAILSDGSGDNRPNHDNIGRVLLGQVSRAIYDAFAE